MKKKILSLTILIIAFLIIGIIFFTHGILNAEILSDPNDIFNVNSPIANQKVSGNFNISWRMYDNNQQVIPYSIKLFDTSSCQNIFYGNINTNNNGFSSASQDNVVSWNTHSTQTTSNLNDGKYCIQICAAFKKGAIPYSICNSRIISIINNNKPPVINSNPNNLAIHENDSWQYQIQASDPNNLALRYYLVYGTNFLSINSQTGLIQTNGNSKALPQGIYRANYNIQVAVDDGLYNPTLQSFTLSIVKDLPLPPSSSSSTSFSTSSNNSSTSLSSSSPASSSSDSNSSQSSSSNTTMDINYIAPVENTVYKGKTNNISFSLSLPDQVNNLTINYSKDLSNWIKITSTNDGLKIIPTGTSYNWDVSGISDGTYYLQIIVQDKQGLNSTKVSSSFQIKNNDQVQSIPLIINVNPSNDQEVTDNQPTINGGFVASSNSKIDTSAFRIMLDGNDITYKCIVSPSDFSCKLDNKLNDGLHKITATIKDSSNKTSNYESAFKINTQINNLQPVSYTNNISIFGNSVPRNTFLLILLLFCLSIILLLVPWILYNIWIRRNGERTEIKRELLPTPLDTSALSSFQTTYTTPVTPNVTTNYYKPYNPEEQTTQTSTTNYVPLSSDLQTGVTTNSLIPNTSSDNISNANDLYPYSSSNTDSLIPEATTSTKVDNDTTFIEPSSTD